jgi:hypothetical protein
MTAESPKGANTDDDAKSPKSAGSVGGKAEGVDSDGDDEAEAPGDALVTYTVPMTWQVFDQHTAVLTYVACMLLQT